jgi:transcriptional regulator with XRE-family HTH domain
MTVDYALSRSSFAARIAELRERAGYSQAEVVRRSGGHVSQANLSQWELGAATPNVVYLPSLAAALGVGVWELFEEPSADFKRSPSKYSPTKNARG